MRTSALITMNCEAKMRFEFADESHPLYTESLNLYRRSFPLNEQRKAASQAEIMSNPLYKFALIYDRETFVGIILFWETDGFVYVEHFCILDNMRGKGYGSKALEILKKSGKNIILEIDPPEDDVSRKRKSFYEQNGFCENSYLHIHPPYRDGYDGHRLAVMSYPNPIDEDLYADFYLFLKDTVMKNAKK